jgi:hypothetical protein
MLGCLVCSLCCFTAHLASREEHVVLWTLGAGSARRQSNKEKEQNKQTVHLSFCKQVLFHLNVFSFQLQEWYEKGKSIASGEVVEFTKWKQETVNLVRVAQQYFDGFVSGALKVILLSCLVFLVVVTKHPTGDSDVHGEPLQH